MELIKKSESQVKWLPTSIAKLEKLLVKVIYRGTGFTHVYALRKNLAYNLQYLEFLNRIHQDINLTDVLKTQTYKNFVIIGCSILESLLAFLLIKKGYYNTTEWEFNCIMSGQNKPMDGKIAKIDCHVYKKLTAKKRDKMDFDAMLKKAENKRILGSDHTIYARLKILRKLRNRIHLQTINDFNDTDWNAFDYSHFCIMAKVIHAVFNGSVFIPSPEESCYFNYLIPHCDQIGDDV